MSETPNAKSFRDRLGGNAEDRLGRALSELLESPLLTGAIGRAFDAREKAAQAQELAMGALNLPSAADIERLTRRLRAVSHRLEGIEDGVDRLDRALMPRGVEARLEAIEAQLGELSEKVDRVLRGAGTEPAQAGAGSRAGSQVARTNRQMRAATEAKTRGGAAGKGGRSTKAKSGAKAGRSTGTRSRASKPAAGKA